MNDEDILAVFRLLHLETPEDRERFLHFEGTPTQPITKPPQPMFVADKDVQSFLEVSDGQLD